MLPASCPRRSARRGKVAKQNSRFLAIAARAPAVGAEQEILLHREPREKPPPLGHECDAEVHDLLGRAAYEVVLDAVDDRADAP